MGMRKDKCSISVAYVYLCLFAFLAADDSINRIEDDEPRAAVKRRLASPVSTCSAVCSRQLSVKHLPLVHPRSL